MGCGTSVLYKRRIKGLLSLLGNTNCGTGADTERRTEDDGSAETS